MTEAVDLKGYATNPQHRWLYPPEDMPPKGVKLHILTKGGVAIHGEWRWDNGYLGWQYLPKRDFYKEMEALQYMEHGEMK